MAAIARLSLTLGGAPALVCHGTHLVSKALAGSTRLLEIAEVPDRPAVAASGDASSGLAFQLAPDHRHAQRRALARRAAGDRRAGLAGSAGR